MPLPIVQLQQMGLHNCRRYRLQIQRLPPNPDANRRRQRQPVRLLHTGHGHEHVFTATEQPEAIETTR